MIIRQLQQNDFSSVAEIYRQGIATGTATFETTVPAWNEWNKKYIESCRIVADEKKFITGFAVLSKTSVREAYKGVCEVTVYVHEKHRGKGIGKILLQKLIEQSEENGIWTLQATIFAENKASVNIHEQCGFRLVGYREKIAQRNGEWKNTVLMERRSKNI